MKTALIFLVFILLLTSCNFSKLKKENTQLKHQVDSLSIELKKSNAVAQKAMTLYDSLAIVLIIQKQFDSLNLQNNKRLIKSEKR